MRCGLWLGGQHLDRGFRQTAMTFGIDHQMPVHRFGNGEADRRFFRDAAELFEIQQFGKALEVRTRHQPNIVDGRQGDFDDRAGPQFLQVIMCVAKIRPGHRAPPCNVILVKEDRGRTVNAVFKCRGSASKFERAAAVWNEGVNIYGCKGIIPTYNMCI